jgi:hypothetical protein
MCEERPLERKGQPDATRLAQSNTPCGGTPAPHVALTHETRHGEAMPACVRWCWLAVRPYTLKKIKKCLIIDIERGESREGRGGESSAGVDWVLSQALPGRAGQGVGPESLVAEYTGRRTNFLGKVGPESWSSEIGPPMPAERSEPTVL